MSFIPQFNPQVVSPGRIRRFNGVFGGANMVIQKADSSGRDLSDGFCNDQQDLNSDENGSIHLREGFTKMGSGGDATIHSIFEVRLGGKIQYASIDGSLTLYDIPWLEYPRLPLPPQRPELPALPSDFPDTFEKGSTVGLGSVSYGPINPIDDKPLADPSEPPAQQACEISHEHSTSPTALTFTMIEGGTLPADQNWYWQILGWWNKTHYGTYNVRPSWFSGWQSVAWLSVKGPCKNCLQVQVRCGITEAAKALDAGTYTFTHNLIFTDGGSHACDITLSIYTGYTGFVKWQMYCIMEDWETPGVPCVLSDVGMKLMTFMGDFEWGRYWAYFQNDASKLTALAYYKTGVDAGKWVISRNTPGYQVTPIREYVNVTFGEDGRPIITRQAMSGIGYNSHAKLKPYEGWYEGL